MTKGRVRYATAAENRALRAQERAAEARGEGGKWRRQQRAGLRRAEQADRAAGIPWWRRV